jgi:hypothetical protein
MVKAPAEARTLEDIDDERNAERIVELYEELCDS